jgi:hypothetical protein
MHRAHQAILHFYLFIAYKLTKDRREELCKYLRKKHFRYFEGGNLKNVEKKVWNLDEQDG